MYSNMFPPEIITQLININNYNTLTRVSKEYQQICEYYLSNNYRSVINKYWIRLYDHIFSQKPICNTFKDILISDKIRSDENMKDCSLMLNLVLEEINYEFTRDEYSFDVGLKLNGIVYNTHNILGYICGCYDNNVEPKKIIMNYLRHNCMEQMEEQKFTRGSKLTVVYGYYFCDDIPKFMKDFIKYYKKHFDEEGDFECNYRKCSRYCGYYDFMENFNNLKENIIEMFSKKTKTQAFEYLLDLALGIDSNEVED